ncbi:dipeptide ABC transporter ATP-binding protein [Yaniella flava]|uniref:Dipeptide ABC transporter ATP-binding protein n=1 Tax=Yaniella flava TaxID=287930 RepID=A0ABP5FM27_9MICC
MRATTPMLSVRGMRTEFPVRSTWLQRLISSLVAVNNVDLDILPGQTVGLVGESGSGKSTLARSIIGLEDPAAGTISFDGQDLAALTRSQRRATSRDIQMIFQDPGSSLNPRRTAYQIISEGWRIHRDIAPAKGTWRDEVTELLERVGLSTAHLDRYPHQFSGGQRQRISIARALSMRPKLIICDEPVSALDVSVQAQVLNLLAQLQTKFDLTYLFISHDLSVVRHISDRVVVMYKGRIIEAGSRDQIFDTPRHPYTQMLLSSIPVVRPWRHSGTRRIPVRNDADASDTTSAGCAFAPRCPWAFDRCWNDVPELQQRNTSTQQAACHLSDTQPAPHQASEAPQPVPAGSRITS